MEIYSQQIARGEGDVEIVTKQKENKLTFSYSNILVLSFLAVLFNKGKSGGAKQVKDGQGGQVKSREVK